MEKLKNDYMKSNQMLSEQVEKLNEKIKSLEKQIEEYKLKILDLEKNKDGNNKKINKYESIIK